MHRLPQGRQGHAPGLSLLFSTADRERLRDAVVARAEDDPQVVACAEVGSAAHDATDRWSDIDLALRLAPDVAVTEVADAWTSWLRHEVDVADTLDLWASGALYRVFLLAGSLQVDLSFWPHDRFRSTRGPFRLVFGTANPAADRTPDDPSEQVGRAWLHALHVRSALARGRRWQGVAMLDGLRDHLLALTCLRHGLDPRPGRATDRLPAELLEKLEAARARDLSPEQLARSLAAHLGLLLEEVRHHDASLADRLGTPFGAMVDDGTARLRSAPSPAARRTPPRRR